MKRIARGSPGRCAPRAHARFDAFAQHEAPDDTSQRSFSAALAGLALVPGPASFAQAAYPDRPITLIVPWGACGGTDAVERILATLLEETWVIRSRDSWPRATPAGLDDDQGRNPNPAGSGPPADRSSCCSAWSAALPSTTALFGGLVMLVAGVAAFFMERWGFPLAPTILGVVLGTMLEEHFFSSLVTADGNFLVFVGRPIAGVLGVDPAGVAVAGGPHA